MTRLLAAFSLTVLLLAQPARWMGFETDQYNLPPTPLADIGGEVYEYTLENITKAIEKVNEQIREKQSCLERPKCDASSARKRLEHLRSEAAVARAQWRAAYPTRSRQDFQLLTDSLRLWNGESYGHKESQKFVTIAATCY